MYTWFVRLYLLSTPLTSHDHIQTAIHCTEQFHPLVKNKYVLSWFNSVLTLSGHCRSAVATVLVAEAFWWKQSDKIGEICRLASHSSPTADIDPAMWVSVRACVRPYARVKRWKISSFPIASDDITLFFPSCSQDAVRFIHYVCLDLARSCWCNLSGLLRSWTIAIAIATAMAM